MKKEVTEHLSRAFFEKKSRKRRKKSFLRPLVFGLSGVVLLAAIGAWSAERTCPAFSVAGRSLVLGQQDGPYALPFDFSNGPVRVRTLVIDLGCFDARGFDELSLSLRIPGENRRLNNSVKVCLVNRRKETSSLYVSEINNSWKNVSLSLADFRQLHDLSCLTQISFILEDWNLGVRQGRFLADEIVFSKKHSGVFN